MANRKKLKISTELKIAMYKKMLLYRRFEEKVLHAYTQQKFAGFCHLHIGQEAVCVGVGSAMTQKDYVITGYRSHTQAIEKGIPAQEVFAELFGKVTGCSRGKGGSMHMFSKEKRFLGGHGIVGGQAPLGAGAAFAISYLGRKEIVVCYLGDAAMNQGQVHEAMNMAATWKLPVLYIIENNRYGMGTDIKRTTSIDSLADRALAFNMAHSQIAGMDVLEIYEHVLPIIEEMRKNPHPYLLEVMTYRYKGHSVSDPGTYRTKEEVQAYIEQDPITLLGKELLKDKLATNKDLELWDAEARQEVKLAEQFADDSAFPDPKEAWEHVLV